MLADDCAEAFFFNKHKVLGKKLRPFCLYHHFVLDAIDSPVISGTSAVGVVDLYIAAIICSQEYPIDLDKIPKASPLSILWNSVKMGYFSTRYKISREYMKFLNYMKDYSSMPSFWNDSGKGVKKNTGIPDVLSIMTTLIVSLHYSETAAWNCPVGKAVWLATSAAIINGAESKIITPEAKAFMDSMRNGKNG